MSVQRFEADVSATANQIVEALHQRWTINVNKESGVARWPANTDCLNPCVTLSRDEIRGLAGREKLRDVFVTQLQVNLASRHGVSAEMDYGSLKVCITPVREPENEFVTFRELQKKNRSELLEDPDLGDDPY